MLKFRELKKNWNDKPLPQEKTERVKYAMAYISRSLAEISENNSSFFSLPKPLVINCDEQKKETIRYLWTAAMIFVLHSDKIKGWNKKIILINNWINFDAKDEINGSVFTENSLYETVFSSNWTLNDIQISKDMPLYEGISGVNDITSQTNDYEQRFQAKYLLNLFSKNEDLLNLLEKPLSDQNSQFFYDYLKYHRIFQLIKFPETVAERVHYSMAIARRTLNGKHKFSPDSPVHITATNTPLKEIRYLWTALMLTGFEQDNFKTFSHKCIKIESRLFNPDSELNLFGSFSKTSLYETEFRFHYTTDMRFTSDFSNLYINAHGRENINKQYEDKKRLLVFQLLQCAQSLNQNNIIDNSDKSEIKHIEDDIHIIELDEEIQHPFTFKSTDKFNLENTFYLARCLEDENSEKSLKEACEYYSIAVQKDHIPSYDALERLAASGLAYAQFSLGYHYYHRKNNFQNAVHWCLKAAEQNLPEAISYIFETDFGVERYLMLAHKYEQGDGVTKCIPSAIIFYEKAALLKDINAAVHLGELYQLNHTGLKKNLTLSFQHYLQAARLGNCESLESLERLGKKVNAKNQMALSQFYGSFFNDQEKALYWKEKAREAEPFKP